MSVFGLNSIFDDDQEATAAEVENSQLVLPICLPSNENGPIDVEVTDLSCVAGPSTVSVSPKTTTPVNSRQAKWDKYNPSLLRQPTSGVLKRMHQKKTNTSVIIELKAEMLRQSMAERRELHLLQVAILNAELRFSESKTKTE